MMPKKITRRTFLKNSFTTAAAAVVATAPGCRKKDVPAWFELSQWDVTVSNLGKAFDGFRILQLTDIHQSEWMDANRMAELKDFVLSLEIDLIVVTGDSTYHTTDFRILQEFYTGLNANAPIVMTWGNHDIWDDAPTRMKPLIHESVIVLENERMVIEREQDQLIIAGLNCAYEELDDLAATIDEIPSNTPALMLAHEPDVADAVAETRLFFLQLSGHSHGGQICLPNGYAPMLPWLGQRYSRGFYEVNGMMLYTSRGLGRGKPFVRTFCPGEAVILTLHCGERTNFGEI